MIYLLFTGLHHTLIPTVPKIKISGMIIFPNRKERQVVFLEAKNRKNNPSVGKTELMKKMHKLQLSYKEEILVKGKDAVLYFDML